MVMIIICNWADLIIWLVYMKSKIANSACNGMILIWYEYQGGLIIKKRILKDEQRSLRSRKAISNQGGSNSAERRSSFSKFSCILFRSFHYCFLNIVIVISKSLNKSGLSSYFVNPLTRWQFNWIVLKTSNKSTPNRVIKSSNRVTPNSVFCNL